MKHSVLLIWIFFISVFNAYPQAEWAPIGAIWYYSTFGGIFLPTEGYIKIECIKDTIFNERNVRILKKESFLPNGSIENLGPTYTFQEENKIYYWTGTSFSLLYDFSTKLNDYWQITSKDSNPCGTDTLGYVKVDSTGQQIINENNLNYMYVSARDTSMWTYSGKIIEKIGCLGYMFPVFNNICNVVDIVYPGPLRCYFDNTLGNINFLNIPCDTLINLTNVEEDQITGISIYPNPVHNRLNIEIQNSNTIITSIKVYDITGQIIKTECITNNKIILDFGCIQPGLYFLIFENNQNKHLINKIIKN